MKAGLLAGLILLVAVQVHGADPDTLYVRHVEGVVELAESGSGQRMEAAVNTPLIEGDTLRTGASGKAELFLKDGSVVRVGRNSELRIIAVGPQGIQFKLHGGTAYIVARGSKDIPVFLDTPSAALGVAMPATLRVDVYDGAISEVSVYKGEVYAAQQKGRMPVRAGERLVLGVDGSAPVLGGLRAGDDWLRWNADRDRATFAANDATESYAYLPDELRAYSSDLDANGQWVYTPEYNYVWVPTVITVSTWSPYRFGRWVWIRGSYVWVGYEPWGWAPYHYGRWVHHRHAGWCWVPPARGHVRWEPAHVAWVHSSRHVGWVPLAPGETYDRRTAPVIYQTNNYTIYNNVTLERSVSTARTAHANAGVSNAVVTVERDSMLRAKAVSVNVTKTGAVPLRKVSLPAGVVPARAKSEPARTIDRQRTPTGKPGEPGLSDSPTRGAAVPSAMTQKTTAGPRSGMEAGAASPVNTKAPVDARPLAERISAGRSSNISGAAQPVPAVPSPGRTDGTSPGRVIPRASTPAADAAAAKPSAVMAPSQSTQRPAQPTRTQEGSSAVTASGNQGTAVVRVPETRQPLAPRNTPAPASVSTPSQSAPAQVRPAAVTAAPSQSTQKPIQPAVKAPEAPRQAVPRVEQRPAAAQREKAEPQAARQDPVKERVAPAPASVTPPAAAPDKGETSKPIPANGGSGFKAQQGTPMKQVKN